MARLGEHELPVKVGKYVIEWKCVGAGSQSFSVPFTQCFEVVMPYGPRTNRAAFKFFDRFHPNAAGEPQPFGPGMDSLEQCGGAPNYEIRFPEWSSKGIDLTDDQTDDFTLLVDIEGLPETKGYIVRFRLLINRQLVAGAQIVPQELPTIFEPEVRNRLSPGLCIRDYRAYY